MQDDILTQEPVLILKPEVHYIVTKGNETFPIGTPLYLQIENRESYTVFGICRVGTSKKNQQNDVWHFHRRSDLIDVLAGVEVVLDIGWARDRIDTLETELSDIKTIYQLD